MTFSEFIVLDLDKYKNIDGIIFRWIHFGYNTINKIVNETVFTREEVGQSISRLTHQHKIRNRGLIYELI